MGAAALLVGALIYPLAPSRSLIAVLITLGPGLLIE
jgi:hypothetical protein